MKILAPQSQSLLLLAVLAVASCSQAPSSPTSAVGRPEKGAEIAAHDGSVRGSAAGDVKNGPIEMDLVRVGQTDGVPAFYAYAGSAYTVRPNREVEIYVQIWAANPAVATAPRLIVDWGVGEADNIHCGPCRVSRTYRTEGRYTVTVTMDDRAGGVTRRTFTLNVSAGVPTVPVPQAEGFGTFTGTLDATDPQFNWRLPLSFVPPATGLPCSFAPSPSYYDTYRINHLGGPLRIETVLGTLPDSVVYLYAGSFNPSNSCQNSVAGDDDNVGSESLLVGTFPAGEYVVVVTSFDGAPAGGTYTVKIQN